MKFDTWLITFDPAIERLGGEVPAVGGPAGVTKAQKQAWRREVRRKYFVELSGLVGCLTGKIAELKVLEKGGFSSLPSWEVRWSDYLVFS